MQFKILEKSWQRCLGRTRILYNAVIACLKTILRR